MRLFPFLLLLPAAAQEFAIPVIGHVFDPELASIRQIVGTPGAARVTPPVALPVSLNGAVVHGSRAFASIPDQGLSVVTIDAEPQVTAIPESLAAFDHAALSPGGSAAVIYQKDCACLQTFAGLHDEPHVVATLPAAFDGELRALAVNDDLSIVAASTSTGIHLLRDGEWRLIDSVSSPSVAFAPGSERIAWIHPDHSEVRLLHLSSGEIGLVAPEGESWVEPQTVGFVGASRLVVGTGLGVLVVRDLETQESRSLECACRPEVVERLSAAGMFRLTGIGSGAVWVLALPEQEEPRTFFVPVDREEVQ